MYPTTKIIVLQHMNIDESCSNMNHANCIDLNLINCIEQFWVHIAIYNECFIYCFICVNCYRCWRLYGASMIGGATFNVATICNHILSFENSSCLHNLKHFQVSFDNKSFMSIVKNIIAYCSSTMFNVVWPCLMWLKCRFHHTLFAYKLGSTFDGGGVWPLLQGCDFYGFHVHY